MTTRTQGLVMAALAVVLIRLSLTGEYLRFVTTWMRWPLFAAGLILLVLAIRPALGLHPTDEVACHDGEDAGHAGSRSAWLLLLPTLLVFAVTPPPLGAFLAERRGAGSIELQKPVVVALPEGDEPVPLGVGEFSWGAAQKDDPMGLAGRRVVLSGFVSSDKGGGWFVTRLEIGCCAADASVMRVRVTGADAPPRDQWVEVTGTWQEGTGGDDGEPPVIVAEQLKDIAPPEEVYG